MTHSVEDDESNSTLTVQLTADRRLAFMNCAARCDANAGATHRPVQLHAAMKFAFLLSHYIRLMLAGSRPNRDTSYWLQAKHLLARTAD